MWFTLFCFDWKTKSCLGRFCSTQSIADTSEIPSIIYRGTLPTAEQEHFAKFPTVPRGNTCHAAQGGIQLAAEVKSLDSLGCPGGELRYWFSFRVSLEESIDCPGLTSHTYPEAKARNTPWETTLVVPFTGFTSSNSNRATPNSPWWKSDQSVTPLRILTAPVYLTGGFFLCVRVGQWGRH